MTGILSKYEDATASGETVADYLWWTGEGPAPEERYVEVGFRNNDEEIRLRRTPLEAPPREALERLTANLCDLTIAPATPLTQLCTTTIIRDERITALSLDLRETDRYSLLRDALGANQAEAWITRAAQLVSLAKRRTAAAQAEATAANSDVAAAGRRLDQVRATLVAETVVGESVSRLRTFTDSQVSPDQLAGPVRERLATLSAEVDTLDALATRWADIEVERARLVQLSDAAVSAKAERGAAIAAIGNAGSPDDARGASALAAEARDLVTLLTLGRRLGLRDGHCPLCNAEHSHDTYERGIEAVAAIARGLDENAARVAELEAARRTLDSRLSETQRTLDAAESALQASLRIVETFDLQRRAQGVAEATRDQIVARAAEIRQRVEAAQRDLRIIETLSLSGELQRAQRAESDAKNRLARVQERFGRARKAEATAQALHDAARRAAAETLDARLDRVLPLMSELYRRLRPHPIWSDIEYSIRGDVRRFLKLQVGEELNPQFLFSSGQRRATGLAFLLSVNLSLAWSRWKSILFDDPVQHIDDFRTVHLAEIGAQLVASGRQVICAVEDGALADLLCRRLPLDSVGQAKRVTLGLDSEGALAKVVERVLTPFAGSALLTSRGQPAAS